MVKKTKQTVKRIRGRVRRRKSQVSIKNFHCVVKRRKRGYCQDFDEKKLYGSVYAACYIVHCTEMRCEKIAEIVTKKVSERVKKMKIITSTEILRLATRELKKHNKHAAFMYRTHRDIS
jgi:transcriptional regulator NrdR family protein